MSETPIEKPPTKGTNPLLSRIQMPGETFALPSGGLFYESGELAVGVKNAEVHVHPMTAIDEILLKTPDLLFSGEAIVQVFNHCIPQIEKPLELLAKDVDFLLVCLRKVSFGDLMEIEHTHTCENAQPHTYNISIDDFVRSAVKIEPITYKSKFRVTLTNNQIVDMSPIRFKDYIRIMQAVDSSELTPEDVKNDMVESLANVIRNVDEITDHEFIKEWLDGLDAGNIRKITGHIEKMADWGPTFKSTIKCKDCGKSVDVYPPMNPIAFFT